MRANVQVAVLAFCLGTMIFGPIYSTCDEPPIKASSSLRNKLSSLASAKPLQADKYIYGADASSALYMFYFDKIKKAPDRPKDAILNIGKFAGFISGRMNIEVPEWWIETLLASRDNFGSYPDAPVFHESQVKVNLGCKSYTTSKVKLHKDAIVIDELVLSLARLSSLRDSSAHKNYLALSSVENSIILAFYDRVSYAYKLLCLDKEGVVRWTSLVWAGAMLGVTGSGHFHNVSIVCNRDTVGIFGACNNAIYFEAFHIKSGDNLARFHSQLWGSD